MTWFEYMTSDTPFKDKENEYILEYTVAEAIEKGIPLSNREKAYPPNIRIIKQLEGYDTADFSIQSFKKYSVDMRDTDKAYCAAIWYMGTLKKAEILLQYLYEHMEQSDEVELWHLFQGAHTDKPYEIDTKITTVLLDELTAEAIYEFFYHYENAPCCMIVKKHDS